MEAVVDRIKVDLYNGDDSPDTGLVPELRAYLRSEAQRRWKRADKIAFGALIVLLLAWPAAQAYDFVHTVWEITQEWHQAQKNLHHSFFNVAPSDKQNSYEPSIVPNSGLH